MHQIARGRLLIIAAFATASLTADAQTLYRCVERGKPTSFQAEPCPPAATTASAVAYVPERNAPSPPPAAGVTSQPRRRQTRARVHQITVATNASACEAARARRDAVVGANNQRGNVDVRRVLNDAVAKACY